MTSGIAPAHTLVSVHRKAQWGNLQLLSPTHSSKIAAVLFATILLYLISLVRCNNNKYCLGNWINSNRVTLQRSSVIKSDSSSSVAMSTHRAGTRPTTLGLYSERQECADAINRIRLRVCQPGRCRWPARAQEPPQKVVRCCCCTHPLTTGAAIAALEHRVQLQ